MNTAKATKAHKDSVVTAFTLSHQAKAALDRFRADNGLTASSIVEEALRVYLRSQGCDVQTSTLRRRPGYGVQREVAL